MARRPKKTAPVKKRKGPRCTVCGAACRPGRSKCDQHDRYIGDQPVVGLAEGWEYRRRTGTHATIGQIGTGAIFDVHGLGLSPAEVDSLGRFIAQAPDMLKALRGMIERYEQASGERPHDFCGCTYCKARALAVEAQAAMDGKPAQADPAGGFVTIRRVYSCWIPGLAWVALELGDRVAAESYAEGYPKLHKMLLQAARTSQPWGISGRRYNLSTTDRDTLEMLSRWMDASLIGAEDSGQASEAAALRTAIRRIGEALAQTD